MGFRPGDNWCIPLSCAEHARQHDIGERPFWGDNLELAKQLAQFLYKHTGNRQICMEAIEQFKLIGGYE